MQQKSVIVTLGLVQVIILTLFGMYFYRLKHTLSQEKPASVEESASQGGSNP